ncbi:MAG: primosomal protein N' [Tissierellales bacterium]|nr:primosomal protein N' [Tissierellales bacterium]
MKLLDVILYSKSRALDKTFTYSVSDNLADKICIGKRVLVPFGKKNNIAIGIILKVREDQHSPDEINDIKSIFDVIDETPLISETQIALALWIKKEYLSTYIDSFNLFMPPPDIKNIKLSYALNNNIHYVPSMEENIILKLFEKSDNFINIDSLPQIPDKNINDVIKKMTDNSILLQKYIVNKVSIDRQLKFYSKNKKVKEEEGLERIPKNAKKQIDIWLSAWPKEEMTLNELYEEFNTSYSTIFKLIEKNLLVEAVKKVNNNIITSEIPYYDKHNLNQEQKYAFERIIEGKSNSFLIHGITGSGKTEIYLQLVEEMLKENKSSIILVPEILLTPQIIERFVGRFGQRVAVLHSKLTLLQKLDQWYKIKRGELDIVIGARSAVFAPINRLGLLIIDEEHENSYKSSVDPKYNTIDVALKRCELEGAKLILGSATPSIESYYNAKNSIYELLEIKNRVESSSLPMIDVVDMRDEINNGNTSIFSRLLYDKILKTIQRKQQVILFLNKRGYSSFVSCRKCGYVVKCDSCDVSMTSHKQKNRLICHYCGKTKRFPNHCPVCGSEKFKEFGIGTEKLETVTKNMFPNAKVKRVDSDTIIHRDDYKEVYEAMKNNEIDILIGTQMISKGFDFPNVSLVGIVAADTTIFIPDFRSSERSFQLITQVSGRAGRGRVNGNVIIQTYNPDHYSIRYAKENDYENFYNTEINLRKEFQYPPFTNIVLITVYGPNPDDVKSEIIDQYNNFSEILEKNGHDISMISKPHVAPIEKINNNFRYQVTIKYSNKLKYELLNYIDWVFIKNRDKKRYKLNKLSIDIDPVNIL